MAQLMRMGWFRPVHVEAPAVQEMRALPTARNLLVTKLRDVESSIRGLLRGFGLKVAAVSSSGWSSRCSGRAPRAAGRMRYPPERAAQGGARG
jgi:transposase